MGLGSGLTLILILTLTQTLTLTLTLTLTRARARACGAASRDAAKAHAMVEMSCALSRRGAATSGARHRCACTRDIARYREIWGDIGRYREITPAR